MRILLTLVLFCASLSTAAFAEQTTRLDFVKEYVRQLSANDRARDFAALDAVAPSPPQFPGALRGNERIVTELSNQIKILNTMRLPEPFERLAHNVADFYRQKIELYNSTGSVTKASTSDAKDGGDRGADTADASGITAAVDSVDRALLESTPMIFAVLVDTRPDDQGHMTRLLITRKERDQLLRALDTGFGNKLYQPNQNSIVSAAALLRFYLVRKEYKSADDL